MLEANPNDIPSRLVFSDWLEQNDDPRGELLRLTTILSQSLDIDNRAELEARLYYLIDKGVEAVGPFQVNSIGMRSAWIPPGVLRMGGKPRNEVGGWDPEPQQLKLIERGFYIGIHPVTQAQWQAVTNVNPSKFKGEHRPVECISWHSAIAFCNALSQKEGRKPCYRVTGRDVIQDEADGYRLPTEAEWEYACRAGTTAAYCYGDNPRKVENYGWISRNAKMETHPVGLKKPNAWGLFDVHGNVDEWCWDLVEATEATGYFHLDHREPNSRIARGGNWMRFPREVRSAYRYCYSDFYAQSWVGVRICLA